MKHVSYRNVKQIAAGAGRDLAEHTAAVTETFNEVYENLEAIDRRFGGLCMCEYDQAKRMLVIRAASEAAAGKEGA